MKATELEGGSRVPAVIWSPLIKNQQKVSNMMMHMVDVLPTLCAAAGTKIRTRAQTSMDILEYICCRC